MDMKLEKELEKFKGSFEMGEIIHMWKSCDMCG
jgi:hypothetical protein